MNAAMSGSKGKVMMKMAGQERRTHTVATISNR